jgi:hypothetical protein
VPRVADNVILPSENDPAPPSPSKTSHSLHSHASPSGHTRESIALPFSHDHDVGDSGAAKMVSGEQACWP